MNRFDAWIEEHIYGNLVAQLWQHFAIVKVTIMETEYGNTFEVAAQLWK